MKTSINKITVPAFLAAVIFIVTWTCRIPIPVAGGAYVNLGDAAIYVSAFVFGGPVAAAAAAIGSALADLLAGAAVYIPATFVIKCVMGLVCGAISGAGSFRSFALSCIICGAIMTAGYAVFELAFFGATYALASVPYNLVQWLGCAVISSALHPAAVKLKPLSARMRG